MKRNVINLAILCWVVILCFLFGEMTVRIFYKFLSNYNMEMWRYSADLKQPLPYQKLPFYHFPDKEGNYYGINIKTNSFGLRDYEYSVGKPKDKKRIILLGDSHTLGWGVPFSEIFSKRLESSLNKRENIYQVINMGVGNYNSTMEVELFKLKGLKLNPDMAILMYYINDTEPIPQKRISLDYIISRYSYLRAFLFDRLSKFNARFFKPFQWGNYYDRLYTQENSENLVLNRKSIMELVQLCNKNNIKILIVNIPELRILNNYPFPQATEYIKSLSEEVGVPFLDLLPSLSRHKPESLWVSREDPHANTKTHSIIAQEIYKKILGDRKLSSILQ